MRMHSIKKVYSNETGRSMVEILGVLGIIGVLTVGGVVGYRYAVDKMNANEIIEELKKRSVTASQQRILGQSINLSEYGNNGAIRGYAVNVIDDYYEDKDDFFAIEITAVPKSICNHIIKSDWELPDRVVVDYLIVDENVKCQDDLNNVTFIFHNTLGNIPMDDEVDVTNTAPEETVSGSGTEIETGTGTGTGTWWYTETTTSFCMTNDDCRWSMQGPVCDMNSNQCGPCSNNDDCANNPYGFLCNTDTGLCKKCSENSECYGNSSGELCNASTGKCGECLVNDDCIGNPNGSLCHKKEGICVSCLVDGDCEQNMWCNQLLHVCEEKEEGQIQDRYGTMHSCTTSRLLKITNSDDCTTTCHNRIMQFGYCVPVCADDEWLQVEEDRGTENGQPRSRCLKCNQRTGWHYGTITSSFCNVCPERYFYTDSWGGEQMCALRDCGEGYFNCNNGCCSCSEQGSAGIQIGTGTHGYDKDNNYGVWQGYVYNGYNSCLACANVGHTRRVEGSKCILD